jgi:hypothetical protein
MTGSVKSGAGCDLGRPIPDFAALHPGYMLALPGHWSILFAGEKVIGVTEYRLARDIGWLVTHPLISTEEAMVLFGVSCTGSERGRSAAGCLVLAVLLAAAVIGASTRGGLAQSSIPTVTPPLTGLATPLTSQTTNCMMTCNSQVANCRTACVLPALSSATSGTANATGSTSCLLSCASTHLACQTICAQVSPSR